jgi:hypothetical protein
MGFPLDDAWIHQTYARNLAQNGEWSFIPGRMSAGSTSPLWTFLLSVGFFLGADPELWTYFLGGILLLSLGWISMRWFMIRCPIKTYWGWLVGAAVVLEWHMAWAATSGMEILAMTVLAVTIFWLMEVENVQPTTLGLLAGLGLWIRPGALTLIAPITLLLFLRKGRNAFPSLLRLLAGMGLTAIPYLMFHYQLTGEIWPTTFYAKQAEYAILREQPLYLRTFRQLLQPFIGVGIALLPGLLSMIVRGIRDRAWARLIPLLWAAGYLVIYALLLPVTYQHGRYAMPAVPILMILGFEGLSQWAKLESMNTLKRFISRFWLLSAIAILIVFWVIGASVYAEDVAIIETEMVDTAKWISEHTERDALIAAHDIGALGYFGQREILDLAGLISPEVIPILRDEAALERYLDERGAQYLMTFPGWYPHLTQRGAEVYRSDGSFSPAAEGENMVVYRWRP